MVDIFWKINFNKTILSLEVVKIYKEDFKSGMIFKSEEFPQYDFVIDYVYYERDSETKNDFNSFSIICWYRVNQEAFDKFVCERKGYPTMKELLLKASTFPYPFYGEMKPKSMKKYISKYKMKYAGMSDKEIEIYQDDKRDFSSALKK